MRDSNTPGAELNFVPIFAAVGTDGSPSSCSSAVLCARYERTRPAPAAQRRQQTPSSKVAILRYNPIVQKLPGLTTPSLA
jgi:hypothetical protein